MATLLQHRSVWMWAIALVVTTSAVALLSEGLKPLLRAVSSDQRRRLSLLAPLVGAAALLGLGAGYWHVEAPYPLESERFGVGLAGSAEHIVDYDLEALGAAWYLNWGTAMEPPHPNGAPFMQTIRLEEGASRVSDERVIELVQANPGATWQIGNEPDSIWLDNTEPEAYAAVYHHLYHLIKDHDPTARVTNGGLVQATPLRLAYLDRVWEAYQDQFGQTMPVDVWIVHGFILREQRGSWGADIPPGMGNQANLGMHYELRDHDDLAIFAEQIERFRQWMADHGQRHKPLIVNEYGILMPSDIRDEDDEDFSDDRVIAFMEGTFDYFRTATDPALGYPADGDRLVQAWAWYSLGDNRYRDGLVVSKGYNGDLFTGPYSRTMTATGRAYGTYVVGDLRVDSLQLTPSLPLLEAGAGITVTAAAQVSKEGGLTTTDSVDVSFWATGPGVEETEQRCTVGPVGDGAQLTLTATLPFTAPGPHEILAQVDPSDAVIEVDEDNNRVAESLLVATARVWLPAVLRTEIE